MYALAVAYFVTIAEIGLAHNLKGFDDTVLFDIKWSGLEAQPLQIPGGEELLITTVNKEKYKCFLPNVREKELNSDDNYDGPNALELLSPLFVQSSCSYRLDTYWTYEVCHGRYIRQYHEDREGKKVKIQEYTLGRWDKGYYEILLDELKIVEKETTSKNVPLPMKKIDGVSLPYYELTMSNGTLCDLNENRPRYSKVVYVCYSHGKNDIFSVKEISTCSYEVVILTPHLCKHPKYKVQETSEHQINCIPLENNPTKPRNLMKLKAESAKYKRRSDIRLQLHHLDLKEVEETVLQPLKSPIVDTSPVEDFLAGKDCLNGGTGWWKYEFCYGKSVEQYHVEKDGIKSSINLGRFNRAKHLDWLKKYPQKRPKPVAQRVQLSHLYTEGSLCDKTGKPRQTEVKLKCLENAPNQNAVSLYLLEPRYCEYILGVESPLICDILARADEDGMVPSEKDEEVFEDETSIKV